MIRGMTARSVARSLVVVGLLGFCGFQLHMATGIVHVTRKPGGPFQGCICHESDPNPGVAVWITGPDSLVAGDSAVYTVSIARDSNRAAGFNVATFFGSLGVVDTAGTDTLEGELMHTMPKLSGGRDTISWPFSYRAPQTSGMMDTIYSVANSVDLSTDPTGDAWNFGPNFLVRVTGTSSVFASRIPAAFRLFQNYPNPFNPATVIRFELTSPADVRLQVLDVAGREVEELVSGRLEAGLHEVAFRSGKGGKPELSSGVYFSRLTAVPQGASSAAPLIAARKMLLLK